jgi:MFS family permease
MAASGLGALAGALLLASRRSVVGLGRVVRVGVLLLGAALVAFSFSRHFLLSWGLMLVAGFGMMSSTASINTVLQTIVDEDKRGRVMSFFTMAFIGMAPLGSFLGGTIAQRWGAPASVRAAGGLLLAAGGLFAWYFPHLRAHIRPLYVRLGILPEVAAGLESAMTGTHRPG